MLVGTGAAVLYVRHARRTAFPVLDLDLLRAATFRASILGGFLFRMGIGALPFLLPLLLQTAFGLSPFQSGLVTFASAMGALTMKLTAAPILRRLGFKRVLIGNALISALSLAAIALFQPGSSHALLFLVLLIGGFFRSLQFTSLNTLAYAEIEPERMSRATSFASMAQQLALSVGVGTGALILHLADLGRGGGELEAADFTPAFLLVGVLAALSSLAFLRLPADAGEEISGHGTALEAQESGAASDRGRP
jgi:MFS family permease